jgi:YihY family inner membrane protein
MSEESTDPTTASVSFPKKCLRVLWFTLRKYAETDGEQRAASFAYYALFALFPLIVLFVSVGSQFVNKDEAAKNIIDYMSNYMPVSPDGHDAVIKAVSGVVKSRKPVGLFAVLAVVWSSLGFFHALVRGVNRAWGTLEYSWWKLPFKNLIMLGIIASALFIGIIAPAIVQAVENYIWSRNPVIGAHMIFHIFVYARLLLPSLVLFYAFSMFYKFAPRKHAHFKQIWVAALMVTLALQALRNLFIYYTQHIAHFNVVYGALGSVVALLMWIYLSGMIIILGGCLCAAQDKVFGVKKKNDEF